MFFRAGTDRYMFLLTRYLLDHDEHNLFDGRLRVNPQH
jgi:hypothetical protein